MDISNLKNYIFSYTAISNAHASFNVIRSQDYTVSITCGAEKLTEVPINKQIEINLV